jgi:hypothetical protein
MYAYKYKDIPVPRYFIDDKSEQIKNRNQLIKAYMNQHHGVDSIILEGEGKTTDVDEMTVEEAVAVIQRNERGRLGRLRALEFLEYRRQENKRTSVVNLASKVLSLDANEAGTLIFKNCCLI